MRSERKWWGGAVRFDRYRLTDAGWFCNRVLGNGQIWANDDLGCWPSRSNIFLRRAEFITHFALFIHRVYSKESTIYIDMVGVLEMTIMLMKLLMVQCSSSSFASNGFNHGLGSQFNQSRFESLGPERY